MYLKSKACLQKLNDYLELVTLCINHTIRYFYYTTLILYHSISFQALLSFYLGSQASIPIQAFYADCLQMCSLLHRRSERTLVQVAMSGSTESAAGGDQSNLAKLGNGRMLFAGLNFTHVHELLSPSSGTVDEKTPLQTTPMKVPRVGGRIASLVALPDQSVSVNAPGTLKTTLKETGVEADKIARSDSSTTRGGGGALFMQDIAIAFTDRAFAIMSYVCDRTVEKEAQRSSVLVPKHVFAADTEGVPTHFWPRMLLFDWRAEVLLALSKTQTSHTIECFRRNATQNQSGQFR